MGARMELKFQTKKILRALLWFLLGIRFKRLLSPTKKNLRYMTILKLTCWPDSYTNQDDSLFNTFT